MDWIDLAQGSYRWELLMVTVMDLGIPKKIKIVLDKLIRWQPRNKGLYP
jgi:hypothetical protein